MITKKNIEGLRELFKMAERELALAAAIALKIPVEKLSYKILVGMQKSNHSNVRNLARELALKIPVEKLSYQILVGMQRSDNSNVRNLARELALKIPVEKLDCKVLVEMQESNDHDIRNLAWELTLKIKNKPPKKQLEKVSEFIKKYFSD